MLWLVRSLFLLVYTGQSLFHSEIMHDWAFSLSKEWDVLGPFPVNAREHHFLSPSFPLDLSIPFENHLNKNWSSAYADGGEVTWSKFNATDDNHLVVSFPQIRWSALRATEGWAALQHHNILHTTLEIIPPSTDPPLHPPRLAFSITRGSFFALVPTNPALLNETFTPEWHSGNIYEIPRPPKQLVDLPFPSLSEPSTYHLFISGDYEIRLFGDPLFSGHSEPVLDIGIDITLEPQLTAVELDPTLDVSCDFIDGWAFGTALGIGIRVTTGWWDVVDVTPVETLPLSMSLLYKQRLSPTQSRIVPVQISHTAVGPFHRDTLPLNIKLFNAAESRHLVLTANLRIRHRKFWGPESYEALRATYFLAGTPTQYLALPPLNPNGLTPRPPILALHGAGVDINDAFWSASLTRQPHSWTICPSGRTTWGFDWHGPSVDDVWGSLTALTHLLTTSTSWAAWKIAEDTRVVIIGHSNGGQGTWHIAARYPDRVLAAVPAAAYIKAQQYIPLSLSRGYHFIDPSLRGILDASLTPDDNDLFLSNVVDMKILAIHGGDDENVPTWHSRELVGLVKSWRPDANISFSEDPGKPHWYPEVLASPRVQDFLSSVLENTTHPAASRSFTLTVATPHDSGSLHGLRVQELEIPGRLARIHVTEDEGSTKLRTTNVRTFSIGVDSQGRKLSVDGREVTLPQISGSPAWIQRRGDSWTVLPGSPEPPPIRATGPLSQIMRSPSPLLIVIPTGDRHAQSIGARIAHTMLLYFRLDTEIITDVDALNKVDLSTTDLIIIGTNNKFGSKVLQCGSGLIACTENGFSLHGKKFHQTSLGLLFLHPHPSTTRRVSVFLWGTDDGGLERAARLVLPMRTGITLPEFILIGPKSETFGIGGIQAAGFWNNTWGWSDTMSWLD